MHITLSDNLSAHLSILRSQCRPASSLFGVLAVLSGDKSAEWKRLRQSARLIADDTTEFEPAWHHLIKPDIAKSLGELKDLFSGANDAIEPHRFFFDDEYRALALESESHIDAGLTDELISALVGSIADGEPSTSDAFLSPDPILDRSYLLSQSSLTANNILAVLATSGLEIVLPAIYCEHDEDLELLKDKFVEERQEYVNQIKLLIADCYAGVRKGEYEDVKKYAEMKVCPELEVQVQQFEAAVKKSDADLLKRIQVGFTEGVPAIVAALLDPSQSAKKALSVEVLKVLCSSLTEQGALSKAHQDFPLASYAYMLRKHAPK